MTENIQWRLISRPEGEVTRANFEIRDAAIPEPGPGEVLVRNLYLFIPPSMRLWMNEKPSYFPPQPLGEVMYGITLGVVEASNTPGLPVGTYVNGMGGCQNWSVAPADQLMPLAPDPRVPLAYIGLTEIARVKAGETLVVTAAAGSVGSIACQIGRKLGLKVIGIAGGAEKCAWLTGACGIDAAIDYKHEDVATRLDALIPEGIDAVYENVGGPVFDLILDRLKDHGRVALCGMIAGYNDDGGYALKNLMQLVNKSIRLEGFLVKDYYHRLIEVQKILEGWIIEGSLAYQLDVIDGLDQLPDALARVFHGRNQGSVLIRLAEEPAR
jgi:NADPH-dependent curcumin reductase CurA